ncbi:LLM class flavin-dependent oxidoreductase [Actinoplanes sp. NPDC000266]
MTDKAFKFSVISEPQDGKSWLNLARQAESLGFQRLLMADVMTSPSPFPALGLAAGATTTLRMGTWVLAAPLRAPRMAAWESHTLSVLSGGRFDLGIGSGRPFVLEEAEKLLGVPTPSAKERLASVEKTIDELRALDGEGYHTPILVAAGGPKARALAGARADMVTVAASPFATREDITSLITDIKARAGDRADDIEFIAPIFVIGDETPEWVSRLLHTDAAKLAAADSLGILRGTPRQMADELLHRRETLGVSGFTVNALFIEQFAPVVELLS